jgi:mRNA-degrading endonuclease RelE of RelBE toxin-antitoxin system
LRILHGLARFLATEEGDVKRFQDTDPPELRLRVGAYRVRFRDHVNTIEILAVKHRSEAYR